MTRLINSDTGIFELLLSDDTFSKYENILQPGKGRTL